MEFEYYEGHNWQDRKSDGTIPEDAPAINAKHLNEIEDGIRNALPMTGGKMTGDIVLPGAPESDMSATPKKYVDENIITVTWEGKTYVSEDTVVGKIPNWDESKCSDYQIYFIGKGMYNGRGFSQIAKGEFDEWLSCELLSGAKAKVSMAGDVYLDRHAIMYASHCSLLILRAQKIRL